MKRFALMITISLVAGAACAAKLGIARRPSPIDFQRGKLDALPKYDLAKAGDPYQMDLLSYDLSGLDLKGREKDLVFSSFDNRTRWPESVKALNSFSPEKFMELGKNPGLGLRSLHAKGITGKGVSIAIIDQPLLLDHIEYKDRMRMYEEIGCWDNNSEMHGPAVASIAVRKTVGVAPGADLYYIATYAFDEDTPDGSRDFAKYARAVDRVVAVNRSLPKQNRIRVIAMSIGWDPEEKGFDAIVKAVERAKKQGIFVVSTSIMDTYKTERMMVMGLGREPLGDPDKAASYAPGLFWEHPYVEGYSDDSGKNPLKAFQPWLLVPIDSRCTAGPTGDQDYAFYRTGGLSWSVPYFAGLYALACQVKPDITPSEFWKAAMATGDTIEFERQGKKCKLEKIANPTKLIEKLKA